MQQAPTDKKENRARNFESLLRRNKLKVTQPRLSVLNKIYGKDTATSQPELEKAIGGDIDRVTLYRVLAVFEEKGILHKVFDLNGTATYALCSAECTEHEHHDEHVHFTCKQCNSVYCLDELRLPPVKLPRGFTPDVIGIQVTGTCSKCNTPEGR